MKCLVRSSPPIDTTKKAAPNLGSRASSFQTETSATHSSQSGSNTATIRSLAAAFRHLAPFRGRTIRGRRPRPTA